MATEILGCQSLNSRVDGVVGRAEGNDVDESGGVAAFSIGCHKHNANHQQHEDLSRPRDEMSQADYSVLDGNEKDSHELQLVLPSVALKEVMFAAAWVSDGSTSKYQTRHVSNTPTNS